MRRQLLAVTAPGFVVAAGSAACEDKGPLQEAGGKGPLEKAGKNVDDAAKDLKK